MTNQHKVIVDDLKERVPPIAGIDITPPPHLAKRIAAEMYWRARNSAYQLEISRQLAVRRNDTKEAKALGLQLDRFVRDMAELKKDHPDIEEALKEFDKVE